MSAFLTNLIAGYGYAIVAVLVGLESLGLLVPGETALILAAAYAGSTHQLSIQWVIVAAAGGAILGDNLGYALGRLGGYRFLRHFGHYIRLRERELKVGTYLFHRYGVLVVFFGRFVTVLREFTAFLAGTTRMPWGDFAVANASGAIVWATAYGLLGYAIGVSVERPLKYAGYVLLVVVIGGAWLIGRRLLPALVEQAEAAYPGELDRYYDT